MITIYYNNTSINIEPTDASYRYRKIMGEDTLVLTFNYAGWLDIPVGAYCTFDGTRYTLMSPQGFTKRGTRDYEYKLVMYAPYYVAKKYKFRNPADGRLRFSISCKPQQILEMIVANLNQREPGGTGWTVGGYIDADNALMEFNHTTVLEALNKAAMAFNTEWYFVNKAVFLDKLDNRATTLPLAYGGDNGFVPGVSRSNADEGGGIERVYVQGGDRNIDFSTYGSQTLLLPTSALLQYDPINDKFYGETGYVAANRREYITDVNGIYIERYNKAKTTNYEDSFDGSEFYPSRVGTVTGVAAVGTTTYKIYDTAIDFDYEQYVIGTSANKMTLVFQSGVLAGREFDVDYKHSERSFTLVPIEVEGQKMPADSFVPSTGDKYAVFGIRLPQQYICDDLNKQGASWDMYRAAVRYMAQHEDMRLTFKGSLDPVYAKTNWSTIGPKIALGNYADFSDTQFLPNGTLIRIVGIKDYINDRSNSTPAPEIELSNLTIVPNGLGSALGKIDDAEVMVETAQQQMMRYSQRRWSQAESIQQATEQLIGTLQRDFSEGISPIAVNTMAMLVGDERCQFEFVTTSPGSTKDTNFAVTYNNATGRISAPATILKHLTLGLNVTSAYGRSDSDYRYWNMPALNDEISADLGAVYVYAACDKGSGDGVFYTSDAPKNIEDDYQGDPYYYFLVGILSSPDDEGNRSFAPMYGYTQVLPSGITTNEVRSANGKTVMNLANGQFRVGDLASNYIRWNGTAFEINGLLLAQQAFIDKLGVRNVEIKNNIGSVVGGMQTYEDANTTPYLWLGGDTPDAAPFRVDGNGEIYAQSGIFKGNIYIPFTNITDLPQASGIYAADSRANLIKSDWSSSLKLRLPMPREALNGFAYKLMVVPPLTSTSYSLKVGCVGNYEMFDFVNTLLRSGYTAELNYGYFTFVCLYYVNAWRWALVDASTGGYGFLSSTL